jgi:ribose transport system permease protein
MSASQTEPSAVAGTEPPGSEEPQDTVPVFQRFMERIGQFWTLGVLALLVVAFGIKAPSLYTKQAWLSTSGYAVEYLILAIGQTFVIITAGIDLSVGATLGFSGMAGALVAQHMLGVHDASTLTTIVSILVMLGAGTALGLINGLLITRINLPPFIVTLGTLTGITGGTDLLNGGNEVATLPSPLNALGTTDSVLNGWLPLPVLISIVLAIVFGLILARTRFGLRTYAIGSNQVATRRAGIRVDRHLVWVYTLTGFLAGVAGLMVTATQSTAAPIAGQNDELYAIAAVVIGGASIFGGTGTMFGTVIGTAILSVLTTGLILTGVQPFWQQVAIGAVVIIAVAVDRVRTRVGTD